MSDPQEEMQSEIGCLSIMVRDYEKKLQIAERRATNAEFELQREIMARRAVDKEMISVIHRLEKRLREIDPSYKYGDV